MEINLSYEMIEKVTCTAYARINELKKKIEKESQKEVATERALTRKNLLIKELKKSLSDAEEVHQLFISMLNQLDGQ